MHASTSIARAVRAARGDYDEHCKRLLSERQVIARILLATLDEFKGTDPDVFQSDLIDREPALDMLLERDDTADPGRALLMEGEDSTVGEGLVRFDIRTRVRVPDVAEDTDNPEDADNPKDVAVFGGLRLMEIDIEPQGRIRSEYPLLCRAIYYCGRILSQQGAGVVAGSGYGLLRKAVSIWVCIEPRAQNRSTVTTFKLHPRFLFGAGSYDQRDYDKLEVVVIGLGPGSQDADGIVGLLGTLLAKDIEPEKKLSILHDKYGIIITENINREVRDMGGMGQAIYEDGVKQGEARGSFERLVSCVRGATETLGLTAETALAAFGVPREEWPAVIARLDPPVR